MKKATILFVLLTLLLAACSGLGMPGQPGAPAATQDPAVDTAIAELAGTQMAATRTAEGGESPNSTAAPGEATAIPATAAPQATEPAVTTAPEATTAETEAPAATASPAPATAPDSAGLPAPLLFLSQESESRQIWRLETDGVTVRQLTDEQLEVTDFGVSPVDGRLAYVAGNDLYLANADGSGRTLLVDGPERPAENDSNRPVIELTRPLWSPDGQRIAYGLGGVNIVAAAGGAPALVLQSDPAPQPPDYQSEGPVYFYWPEAWSPDGARLLIGYAIWPEQGGLAVVSAPGSAPLMIQSVESYACCYPYVWAPDGKSVLYANPYPGMILPGLWRSDAATGVSETLIAGAPQNDTFNLPGFVYAAPDGQLYYFLGQSTGIPEGPVELQPMRSAADGVSGRTPLRDDTWLVAEALWAPDGRGVVILDQSSAAPGSFPVMGSLVYLPAGDAAPLPLPATGGLLRWGK